MVFDQMDEISERLQLLISYLMRLSLLVAGCIAVFDGRPQVLFFCMLTLFLSFLPALIEKNYHIMLPTEFEFAFVFFIYGSIFLGEIYDYYYRFWWWDIFLHSISSLILGLIGFIMMYVLHSKRLIDASPFLIAMFAFCFAVALGAIWELFEYGMDTFFGLNMLKEGLVDTMGDLLVDCFGALLVSYSGFIYLRYHEGPIFENVLKKWIKENPNLFKRHIGGKS